MAKYEEQFTRLEHFAPRLYSSEAEKTTRFKRGLDNHVLHPIASTTFETLDSAIVAAIHRERESVCVLHPGCTHDQGAKGEGAEETKDNGSESDACS